MLGSCVSIVSSVDSKASDLLQQGRDHESIEPGSSSIRLFGGLRIEDFEITDDGSSTFTLSSDSNLRSKDTEASPIVHTTEDLQERQSMQEHEQYNNGEVGSHLLEGPILANPVPIPSSHRSQSNATLEHVEPMEDDANDDYAVYQPFTAEEAAEKEASMLSLLASVKDPQMTSLYCERFCMCLSQVLSIWEEAPVVERRLQLEILKRLERSISRAGMLRNICDLETQGLFNMEHLESSRNAVLQAFGGEHSTVQKELQSLAAAVLDAITLFSSVADSSTTTAIDRAQKAL
jgi:hypothetical protein